MAVLILSLSCSDRMGIVAAVAGMLAKHECNIVESAQFTDSNTNRFFMRLKFETSDQYSQSDVAEVFAPVADQFSMDWELHDASKPARVLIMVSKFDHCLIDLLYRVRLGALPMEVAAIVSNHKDSSVIAEQSGIPFYHWPVTKSAKSEVESNLVTLIEKENIELVVLARYMQVLSDEICGKLSGKVINIHHSFLPSFKGAKPYHQAHDRGVKLIGATAHYVTADLDEGPIIDQDVRRVTHNETAKELVAIGRDIESRVLANAVKLHIEHRLFLNGSKTVVFP
ncbi:MAG: formyltetrahydrofolate deformylase [Methyloligellaceae bacterium]